MTPAKGDTGAPNVALVGQMRALREIAVPPGQVARAPVPSPQPVGAFSRSFLPARTPASRLSRLARRRRTGRIEAWTFEDIGDAGQYWVLALGNQPPGGTYHVRGCLSGQGSFPRRNLATQHRRRVQTRKTERGASQFLIQLTTRAEPFALLRLAQNAVRYDFVPNPFGGARRTLCASEEDASHENL